VIIFNIPVNYSYMTSGGYGQELAFLKGRSEFYNFITSEFRNDFDVSVASLEKFETFVNEKYTNLRLDIEIKINNIPDNLRLLEYFGNLQTVIIRLILNNVKISYTASKK